MAKRRIPQYGELDRAIEIIEQAGLRCNKGIDAATAQLIAQYFEPERWPVATAILIQDCKSRGWVFNFANVNRLVYDA